MFILTRFRATHNLSWNHKQLGFLFDFLLFDIKMIEETRKKEKKNFIQKQVRIVNEKKSLNDYWIKSAFIDDKNSILHFLKFQLSFEVFAFRKLTSFFNTRMKFKTLRM